MMSEVVNDVCFQHVSFAPKTHNAGMTGLLTDSSIAFPVMLLFLSYKYFHHHPEQN